VFEIVLRVQIGNEPRLKPVAIPAVPAFCALDVGLSIPKKRAIQPKMIGCFLARLADDRYVSIAGR